ncbi:hypothetical protein [Polymorphospora sp. NPDC050346]|uniref:hypothetical protein n=1 Tax=Polymorphospora sp. NPDC050346 TaxID=3155780 RepID=UPI003409C61A
MSGAYDPATAAASVRELAALSDVDLADGVRAAAAAVVELAAAWRRTGQPLGDYEGDALKTVDDVAAVLNRLPADSTLNMVVDAVTPILHRWWPRWPFDAYALAEAVERLRMAALHQPTLARNARRLVEAGLV